MSSYVELILPRQEESVSWVIEHWSVRIGYSQDDGLSFTSGGNSGVRRILIPSKLDSLEAFPKIMISPTISIIVEQLGEGFPEGRRVPKGTLSIAKRWTKQLDLAIFFFEPLLRQVDIFHAIRAMQHAIAIPHRTY